MSDYSLIYFCHSCCDHIAPTFTHIRDKGKVYDFTCPNSLSHRVDETLRRTVKLGSYIIRTAEKAEENLQKAIKQTSKLEKASLSN